MAVEVNETLGQLKDNLHFIDELDQPAAREVAYQRLQKKLGCTEREMKTLLRHLDQENDPPLGASGAMWSRTPSQSCRRSSDCYRPTA